MRWIGELDYHLRNVVILTLALAALVLWRYRLAVLRGMQAGWGTALPVSPVSAAAARASTPMIAPLGALAWERRTHRQITLMYLFSVGVSALVLAGIWSILSDLPTTPMHFTGTAGSMLSAAVPMIAVSLAVPFWRACRLWLAVLVGGALVLVAVSMLQRLALGKAVTIDQLMNFVYFLQLTGHQLWLPFLIFLLIGNRRLRGVAP